MTFATFTYRNGRFGENTAWIARTAGGYLFGNGYYDPTFYRSPVDAKRAYRAFVASRTA
jgi:hypothetical protein